MNKPLFTLFIIIGIVLLGLYFWFTTDTEKVRLTPLPEEKQESLYDESKMNPNSKM
jgi:hypothetical protein